MENAVSKKKTIFTFALFFVCLIFTLSTTFTFAYFFNKRGETGRYLVGQVKVDIDFGEYNYGGEHSDNNYSTIDKGGGVTVDVKQVLPNMPIFQAVRVALAHERTVQGEGEERKVRVTYKARGCYVRVRFSLEFLKEDNSSLSEEELAKYDDYIEQVNVALANCEIYKTEMYTWKTNGDSCFYLVTTDSANTTSPQMFPLGTTMEKIEKPGDSIDNSNDLASDADDGFTRDAFAYLTRDAFTYPIVGEFNNGVVTYKDNFGRERYYIIKIKLTAEAIQSEYLCDENGDPITSMEDICYLMNESFGIPNV